MSNALKSLLAITVLLTLCSSELVAQYPPEVGSMHPDFELPNVENGDNVTLSEFQGKKVALIHFASW